MKADRKERGIIGIAATNPTVPVSGNVCRYGTTLALSLLGVAVTNEDVDGRSTIDFERDKVVAVPVLGHNGTTGTAVVAGDSVYYNDGVTATVEGVANTPCLNVQAAGLRFGVVVGLTSALAQGAAVLGSGANARVWVYKTA